MRGLILAKNKCSPTLPDGTNVYAISLVFDYRHGLSDIHSSRRYPYEQTKVSLQVVQENKAYRVTTRARAVDFWRTSFGDLYCTLFTAISYSETATMSAQLNKIAVFIDGSNLYTTAKSLGFEIDFKRLLHEFQSRGYLFGVRLHYRV